MKILSICICTLPERSESFKRLLDELMRQKNDYVEIFWDDTERGVITIGAKRQKLKQRAIGEYIVYIDDDDMIEKNYVQLVLEATQGYPDIITFSFNKYVDEMYMNTFVVNRFLEDGNNWCSPYWARNYNPTHKFTINSVYYHLMAVRRELALQVLFIDSNEREDEAYSDGLIPLIKTEKHIEHKLLDVFFKSVKSN